MTKKSMLKIYYLGPEGSNTHLATTKFCNIIHQECKLISVHNIQQGFKDYLLEEDYSYLLLPLENSIEGTVRETLDNLISYQNNNLKMFAEITINIEHCLLANKGTKIENVKNVISHPQAILQCLDSIYEIFGNDIKITNSTSTSKATKLLEQYTNNDYASIANPLCATIYGKDILKTNISKIENNKTRFVAITKFKPDLYNMTPQSVAITFSTKNIAGALASVLDVLAYYNINLSHIDSRPSKIKMGEYIFYCELDTNFLNNNLEIALEKIKNYTNFLTINGEFFKI